MTDQPKIKALLFYTRSSDAHNRQMVANTASSQYRFTEGSMRSELLSLSLPYELLLEIEQAAYKRAMKYEENGQDWLNIQTLLCEFQTEVNSIYAN